jgi:hypothetical protein
MDAIKIQAKNRERPFSSVCKFALSAHKNRVRLQVEVMVFTEPQALAATNQFCDE